MKTLKFMLAAATAIGLASAYAEPESGASTTFESLAVDTPVVTGLTDAGGSSGSSYFYYAGETAEDNESVIAAAGDMTGVARPRGAAALSPNREKILQVSTGTDPLLRAFSSFTGSGEPISSSFTQDVYVDTLVQFTVTPYTDTVTPGAADKLMVYLKESTNEVNDVLTYTTNLVVVAGYYSDQGTLSTKEYVVNGANILPNTWHRLTVKAIPDVLLDDNDEGVEGSKCIGFVVYLDGSDIPCQFNSRTLDASDEASMTLFGPSKYWMDLIEPSKLVVSIQGLVSGDSTLQAVGFAGEGKVDDLMIATVNPFATVFDFTLSYDNTKVSAISYTVGGTSFNYADTHRELEAGTKVKINSITYASGWQEGSFTVVGLADPDQDGYYSITNTASLTIVPAEAPSGEELEPGEQSSTTYASQAAAEAALANVTIAASDAVVAALDSAAQAAYLAKFEKRVVETGSGEYKVEVGLTAAAEADLQAEVDADAAEVIEDLDTATVTLTTTPGFYYSFEYGTTLDNMTEGARTLATGNTLQLTRPTSSGATSGFFKVLVNIAPAAVTP